MDGLRSNEVRMTVFRGRFHIKVDPKGRLSFPTSLRESLGKSLATVITNNLVNGQRCLDLFPLKHWRALEEKIAKMPALNRDVQSFQRFYLAAGTPIDVDSQGRLLIPQHLREYAGLKEDVVVIGMQNKVEIWDQSEWNRLFGSVETNFENVQAAVSQLEQDSKKGDRR